MKLNLFSPDTIRYQSQRIFELTQQGMSSFVYHPEKWGETIDYIIDVIHENYPQGNIPFHSRLNHFSPQGINRLEWLKDDLDKCSSKIEKVQLLFDLVIPSVLLDAGAGDAWSYKEQKTGQTHRRSEGLGVASFHLFASGALSHNNTLETTSLGLKKLSLEDLGGAFQVSEQNPLVGLSGRHRLLQKLAGQIKERPGELALEMINDGQVDALHVLQVVLKRLGPIWPSPHQWEGRPLGDCWPHPLLGEENSMERFIPFHKLSQWLSYSLLDCFKMVDIPLKNVHRLTGLPEYRNGGLFLDLGLLELDPSIDQAQTFTVNHPTIIEWRALTVHLLDECAVRIQEKLNKRPEEFPLACILEGGTWSAGRKIAAQKRQSASPPINLELDGTVF